MLNLPISEELVVQLELLRPVCHRWRRSGECKQGKKCKFRHDSEYTPDARERQASDLPYCARHVNSEGNVYIVARPPISDALKLYWQQFRFFFIKKKTIIKQTR